MKGHTLRLLSLTGAALMSATAHADEALAALLAQRAPLLRAQPANTAKATKPTRPGYVPTASTAAEPAGNSKNTSVTLDTSGVFSPGKSVQVVTPSSTTLSPPVSIVYNGSSPAINVATTGTSKAVQASINNTANTSSALYGQTNGAGGGVTGYNGGTTGFAGKFGVTNNASSQPVILASTTGTGPALLASTTNSSNYGPMIFAKSLSGTGVEASSPNYIGIWGSTSSGNGVYGEAYNGVGVYGQSDSGAGISGNSSTGFGVDAGSDQGIGLRATSSNSSAVTASSAGADSTIYVNNSGTGNGIDAHSTQTGVTGSSTDHMGVAGYSTSSAGTFGFSTYGYGVFGSSTSGWAGYFNGKVAATSYQTVSDRNAKTHFKAVDGSDVLERVNRLPITTWDFKSDDKTHHMGPMAQDFHAQFGLNGDDDKHINLTDIAGVTLAAIQELSRQAHQHHEQLKIKDAQIAVLNTRLEALTHTFEARLAFLERHASTTARPVATRTSRARPDAL